ncbi:hypothetical protein Gotur_005696 [Gossypium turneri]
MAAFSATISDSSRFLSSTSLPKRKISAPSQCRSFSLSKPFPLSRLLSFLSALFLYLVVACCFCFVEVESIWFLFRLCLERCASLDFEEIGIGLRLCTSA